VAQGFDGLMTDYGQEVVGLDASGNGTRAVTFNEVFTSAPHVSVVPDRADEAGGAVYQVQPGSIDDTGFVLEVVGSSIASADKKVCWQAHEKPGA